MTAFENSQEPILTTFHGKTIENITPSSLVKLDATTALLGGRTAQDGWVIMGTTGATTDIIIDLYEGNNSTYNNIRQLNSPTNIDGKIYFTGWSLDHGSEPYSTTGTAESTKMLKDIYEVIPNHFEHTSSPGRWTKAGGTVFFTARDAVHGLEVWKTNGTADGTVMVKDIHPGNNFNSWFPTNLIEFNNMLYFTQNDGTNGTQIWKSDGTAEGTVMITRSGQMNGILDVFTLIDNKLFFAAQTTQYGSEPFMLDENDNLTLLADINPGSGGSDAGDFVVYNDYIYFVARFGNSFNSLRTYRFPVSALSEPANVGVSEVLSSAAVVKLYPNPVSQILTIQANTPEVMRYLVMDVMGKVLELNKTGEYEYDVSSLPAGIYFVRAIDSNNNQVSVNKFLKH